MNVSRPTYELPTHLKEFLPKFDVDTKETPEDHINKFMLVVQLMNVQHEDVVCMLFPYTLEGKA